LNIRYAAKRAGKEGRSLITVSNIKTTPLADKSAAVDENRAKERLP
jgi:hypothetical protein